MHFSNLLPLLLGTLSLVRSTPINPYASKSCVQYLLPINVTSLNFVWGLPLNSNNDNVTVFSTDLGRRDASTTFNPFSGIVPQTAVYNIAGTFCEPNGGGNGTVLLASHGLGFDRSYWDPEIEPEDYSFVDFALAKGYSVFFYDRLGVGHSQIVSGYVNQVSIQSAIITQLVALIRSNKFSASVNKVVLVGHSFGSVISNTVLATDPDLVDGAILTGIAYAPTDTAVSIEALQLRLARLQSPSKWGKLDGGYVSWVDIYANINGFFKAPAYDPAVVKYTDNNKEPFALMELVSLQATNLTSPDFAGPVLVLSGEYDFIFCGGFCPGLLDVGPSNIFPLSKNMVVYSHPESGHAINLSLNATGSFEVIGNFLKENGF